MGVCWVRDSGIAGIRTRSKIVVLKYIEQVDLHQPAQCFD
jgi:hypothetical protein